MRRDDCDDLTKALNTNHRIASNYSRPYVWLIIEVKLLFIDFKHKKIHHIMNCLFLYSENRNLFLV